MTGDQPVTSNATEDNDRSGRRAGALLRETRMAQNLAVADVARQLKLSAHQVEALEAGDFGRLPGPVFVRGFVRNYARLLKLDTEPLLQTVVAGLPREESLPALPSREIPFPTAPPSRWRVYAAVIGAVVAGLAAYEFFPTSSEPAPTDSTAAAPAAAIAPSREADAAGAAAPDTTNGPAAGVPSDRPEGAEQVRTETGGAARPAPVPTGPEAGPTPERTQGATPPAAGKAAAQEAPPGASKFAVREEEPAGLGERQVHMVFDQASWVEIRDRSGKAIFSQLNPPGTEQRVNGRPPLVVIVGNAHGVRLSYDERPVNLTLHTKVDVARLTLP